jgi:RNA polymerase-binding protein DksA
MPSKTASRARASKRRAVRAGRRSRPVRAKSARSARPIAARARVIRAKPVRSVGLPKPKNSSRSAVRARSLGKRELAQFRRMLVAERDRLSEELEAIEEHLPEVEQVSMDASGGYDEDLADVASDTFEREKGFAIENSVQDMLTQVEEALSRMDEGTYGICEVCGQPIHPDRLRALPYARLCINCKAREEQAIPQ